MARALCRLLIQLLLATRLRRLQLNSRRPLETKTADMMGFSILVALVAAASFPAATCNLQGQTNLYVSGNPHMPAQVADEKATGGSQCYGGAGGCPAEYLDMTGLVTAPKSLPTQLDTFV